jgi:hypothetical protein
MIRKALQVAAATIAMAAAVFSAAPAAAAGPPTITGGSLIRFSDGSSCSVSFVDPVNPKVVYTAAHCYDGSTAVMAGGYRIGHFRPDWVYNRKLDFVAIQLYKDVPTLMLQCGLGACRPLTQPHPPKVGDFVCKWGAKTQETCGAVINVWDQDFAIHMPVAHGDSGAPIYQINSDGSAHLVGIVDSVGRADPAIAYGTIITRITDLLESAWGPNWRMA